MMSLARTCFLVVLLATGACRSDTADLPSADLAAERFTTRGRVVAVHAKELEIHHERIASLRSPLGKLEPMEPMTMVFAATAQAPITGIAAGDVVRVEFTANYKTRPAMRLVSIEKLPPETPLELP